jgi:tetratricopeptide (TPR) repeat protein
MKKIIVLVVILAVVAAGIWLGRPAYRAQKEKQFAAQAFDALVKGEHRQALVNAQQVLVINSNNVTACRVMAELADLSRSPNAMVWRRRVAEIEPTRSNRLMFASSALRYEQPPYPLAAQTLTDLADATNEAAFHLVSAQLALKQNRIAQGEKHLEEAIRLEPGNDSHRINLGVVRLESRDPAVSAVAHAELEQRTGSVQALRALAVHHAGRRRFAEAERFSTALLRLTNSTWSDKLEHLAILRGAQSPQFDSFLTGLQRDSGTNVFAASELVTRMTELGVATNAITWVKSMPASMQKEAPLPMALASAYFSLARWRDLEESLNAQNWEERDFARKALLTFALRKQGAPEVAAAHWRDAVNLAGERPELLGALAQMANAWNWTNETESTLWRVAKDFPKERWPLDSLQNGYMRHRNTRGVLEVTTLLLERQPTNAAVQNNWAALALLLQTNLTRAHELARQVYDRDTNNFAFVSTYAWSLHVQGKTAEALKIIETLKPSELEDPSLAGYYGALLAAAGQKEKARQYLDKSATAQLLPEELQIISAARAKL